MKNMKYLLSAVSIAIVALGFSSAEAQKRGKGGTGVNKDSELPRCDTRFGKVALVEETQGNAALELIPGMAALLPKKVDPIPLVRLMANRSGCFQVLERGKAASALQREREMAGMTNKLVVADYLLTAEVVYSDKNSKGFGGAWGGLFGGIGFKSKTSEAQVLLTLTDVKTGIQQVIASGSARKKDVGILGGGLLTSIGVGALGGGYSSTNIGKVTTIAMLDAYINMIGDAKITLAPPQVAALPITTQMTDNVVGDGGEAAQVEETAKGVVNDGPTDDRPPE